MDLKLWWFALQKPVKMHEKEKWDQFDVVAKWLISTRATVTQLTLMAGVIAGLLAIATNQHRQYQANTLRSRPVLSIVSLGKRVLARLQDLSASQISLGLRALQFALKAAHAT